MDKYTSKFGMHKSSASTLLTEEITWWYQAAFNLIVINDQKTLCKLNPPLILNWVPYI